MSSRTNERGGYRTKCCPEMLKPLHSDPSRCTLWEDFHVVYRANLSHMILYFLPRYVEWKLKGSGQRALLGRVAIYRLLSK